MQSELVYQELGILMEWTIKLHENERYAEIHTSGIADQQSSLDMAKALASTLSQYAVTKVLVDYRGIESVLGAPASVYDRPQQFREMGMPAGVKVAEIVRPEHREHFKFLEVVASNRGFNLAVFYDDATALEWLLK